MPGLIGVAVAHACTGKNVGPTRLANLRVGFPGPAGARVVKDSLLQKKCVCFLCVKGCPGLSMTSRIPAVVFVPFSVLHTIARRTQMSPCTQSMSPHSSAMSSLVRRPLTVPININIINPMPFWPSFEPWAKLTPVHVNTIDPARFIHELSLASVVRIGMDKEDARTQSREVLHGRRKQVIRLHRKGIGVMSIVEQTGLSWSAVKAAMSLFDEGQWSALKPEARGKKPGSGRSLTAEQEQSIRSIICDKRPEQLKMDFALWNRAAVGVLIERECGITLSVRAVGNYLKRWGFTPHLSPFREKPIKRAYEQRPEAVQAWLDEQYPNSIYISLGS